MKKKGWQYLLIIGSSVSLTAATAGGLTAGILRYNETHHWSINPYQNYDFNQAKDSLLKAKVPSELVTEYLELTKKITGVIKTNEVVKASELLTLDNKIMNSISQRIIWNQESPDQIQNEISLAKPILTQFYEYYQQFYIYQNNLVNDSLNQMQLKSANTDLYKWSIGTNISDYGLIKNYLESAQETWISKMKMNYILETFLNNKTIFYNSLINQATEKIEQINKQIQELEESKTELLNAKNDAQNHSLLIIDFLSASELWKKEITNWYIATMAGYASQMGMLWLPLAYWALVGVTLGLGLKYSSVEKQANEDLNLQITDIQSWINLVKWLKPLIKAAIKKVIVSILNIFIEISKEILKVAASIASWIMGLFGMTLLTIDFKSQMDMINNSNSVGSDVAKGINDYIKDLNQQINEISDTIKELNIREENYMNQKTLFKSKLNELSNYNKFLKNFNQMNDETFTQTNIFTKDQIDDWKKEVETEYGYLTESSTVTNDFRKAFAKEENNFNNNYFVFKNKVKDFFDNYNNNDKEYFIKNLLVYIENPLKNNDIYFNTLNLNWNNYDDIFEELE